MLAVIIHHLAGGDVGLIEQSETRSVSRRDKLQIEKKIRKEIGESTHTQIMGLRQLIPLPRDYLDIVKYEKAPVDKDKSWRTGSLKPVGKEKVSPWDLIEGLKNTYPLSLSWFGASRSPRLPEHWQYRVRMGELPARAPMEKWLELADLPPDDVQEPVKKEVKTENILPTQQNDPTKRMGPPFGNMQNSQPQNQTQFTPNMMQMNNQPMNNQVMNPNNMMRRPSQMTMQPMIPQQPEMLRNQ